MTRRTIGAMALLALAAGIAAGALRAPSQDAKLVDPEAENDDVFGITVAVDGDTAVVGSSQKDNYRGAALVFRRTGTTWALQATLTPADAQDNDSFAVSVAVSGDSAVVGSPGTESREGAAYVFTRSGTNWSQQQKLTSTDCAAEDQIGASVAIEGDTALVGAPLVDAQKGAVYVFTRTGTTWTQQAKLSGSDAVANDLFGSFVALSGDTALVSAYGKDAYRGAAYVFKRTGTVWAQQAKLTAADGAANDLFGISVGLSGDTAAVGAYYNDSLRGAVYVFTRTGSVWAPQTKLTAADAQPNDGLGISVGIDGDTLVTGAASRNSNAGVAFVFTRTGTAWTQQASFAASDVAGYDLFGKAIALSGGTALVGSSEDDFRRGAAYVFDVSAVPAPSPGYCLVTKIKAKANAAHPEKSTLTASGVLETGAFAPNFERAGTFDAGGFHLDIPAFVRKGSSLVYSSGGIALKLTPEKRGLSRSAFSVKVIGDLAGKVDLGAPLVVSFKNDLYDLEGSANSAGGARAVVTPELAVLGARASVKGGGADSLKLTLGFVTDGVVPDVAEDLTIGFGGTFAPPLLPARSFSRKGDSYVYASKEAGISKVTVDYAKGTIAIAGKGIDLGAFQPGGNVVAVTIVRGGKLRTAQVQLLLSGTKLSY